MKHEVRLIENQLECNRVVPLEDDIWFWDRAAGLICEDKQQNVIRVFVYQTPGSALKSAVEQGVPAGSAIIAKDRMLISGDLGVLSAIERKNPELPKPLTEFEPAELTPSEDDAVFCVRAVSAHAMLTIEGDEEPPGDIRDLDTLYPGYSEKVSEIDSRIDHGSLVRLHEGDALTFEGALSRIGPSIKKLCRRQGDSR